MTKEERSVIVAIRVPPDWKELAREEAKERGQTLTGFIWDLIEAGFEKIYVEDSKEDAV